MTSREIRGPHLPREVIRAGGLVRIPGVGKVGRGSEFVYTGRWSNRWPRGERSGDVCQLRVFALGGAGIKGGRGGAYCVE